MKVDIIGGGIGGLTTAIALQQKGIQSNVYEQATIIKPVGAGIILANNAMQVYEHLGLSQQIEDLGNEINEINLTDTKLKPISHIDLRFFEKKYGVRNTAIHRAKLIQLLVENLESDRLNLDHCLAEVNQIENSKELLFENGAKVDSQVLLGADGIHSKVRNLLFEENEIRTAGQICWRGIANYSLPSEYQHQLNEAWGSGDRFGIVPLSNHQVYWYALKAYKKSKEEFLLEQLEGYFSSYHPIVNEVIKNTELNNIHTAEITDLKPIYKWYKDNVALLGDAAHATTPNMGQGACQSIEDAYVLTECMAKYGMEEAFMKYQQVRIRKAHHVVNASWQLGKASHWQNPFARLIRDTFMRITPEFLGRKQSEKIFELPSIGML